MEWRWAVVTLTTEVIRLYCQSFHIAFHVNIMVYQHVYNVVYQQP